MNRDFFGIKMLCIYSIDLIKGRKKMMVYKKYISWSNIPAIITWQSLLTYFENSTYRLLAYPFLYWVFVYWEQNTGTVDPLSTMADCHWSRCGNRSLVRSRYLWHHPLHGLHYSHRRWRTEEKACPRRCSSKLYKTWEIIFIKNLLFKPTTTR